MLDFLNSLSVQVSSECQVDNFQYVDISRNVITFTPAGYFTDTEYLKHIGECKTFRNLREKYNCIINKWSQL